MRLWRSLLWLSLTAAVPGLTGCGWMLGRVLVRAPNAGRVDYSESVSIPEALQRSSMTRQLRIHLGPESESLWCAVLDPPTDRADAGTIIVLHGWRKNAVGMKGFVEAFLGAGYRVVMVDLRGHGNSTGDWLTYGVEEARDLARMLDVLEERSLIGGPVGVFGISYGAAVALQYAASDRRVSTVVSVASFSSLRTVVPRYVRLAAPFWGWFVSDATIQTIVDESAANAGFDPDAASPAAAIVRLHIPVLLVHGADDFLIPPRHAEALYGAGAEHATLALVEGVGHNSAFADSCDRIKRLALKWFHATLRRARVSKPHALEPEATSSIDLFDRPHRPTARATTANPTPGLPPTLGGRRPSSPRPRESSGGDGGSGGDNADREVLARSPPWRTADRSSAPALKPPTYPASAERLNAPRGGSRKPRRRVRRPSNL